MSQQTERPDQQTDQESAAQVAELLAEILTWPEDTQVGVMRILQQCSAERKAQRTT